MISNNASTYLTGVEKERHIALFLSYICFFEFFN